MKSEHYWLDCLLELMGENPQEFYKNQTEGGKKQTELFLQMVRDIQKDAQKQD